MNFSEIMEPQWEILELEDISVPGLVRFRIKFRLHETIECKGTIGHGELRCEQFGNECDWTVETFGAIYEICDVCEAVKEWLANQRTTHEMAQEMVLNDPKSREWLEKIRDSDPKTYAKYHKLKCKKEEKEKPELRKIELE